MAREPDLPTLKPAARFAMMAGAWWFVTACASAPPTQEAPAVLTNPTFASRAELFRVVRRALRGAPVTLADDALTRESTLIVERAPARGPDGTPLQGRERGRPERFQLVKDKSRCVLVHESSGRRFPLSSTACAPR